MNADFFPRSSASIRVQLFLQVKEYEYYPVTPGMGRSESESD